MSVKEIDGLLDKLTRINNDMGGEEGKTKNKKDKNADRFHELKTQVADRLHKLKFVSFCLRLKCDKKKKKIKITKMYSVV
jgi:hypothetical protein